MPRDHITTATRLANFSTTTTQASGRRLAITLIVLMWVGIFLVLFTVNH